MSASTLAGAPTLAGVDGCPSGWAVVLRHLSGAHPPRLEVFERLNDLVNGPDAPAVVAIDMPIGLPERAGLGGRGPERAVRPLLGARQSSVFSVPSRAAVHAAPDLAAPDAYRTTCAVALATSDPPRQISKQCFHILGKIREVDAVMTSGPKSRIHEVHPEVAFWQLAGGQVMRLPKKVKNRRNPEGLAERIDVLVGLGYDRAFLEGPCPRGVGRDDLIDAAVAALIAERLHRGEARPFPNPPERDGLGLPIAIWA